MSTLHFTLRTPHFTLYTPHSTLYTLHLTLYPLHSTLYTPHFTLYTPHNFHFTLYTPHSTPYTWHSTLHTLHCTLYTLHPTLSTPHSTTVHHTLHFTLHALQSTLYSLHSTLHTLHLTLRTLHSTFYTLHFTLYTPHFALYTPHSTLHTLHSTLHTLRSTLHTLHSTLFCIAQSTVHWHGKRGKMFKTAQTTCFTKVFYVTAFGFVGCMSFWGGTLDLLTGGKYESQLYINGSKVMFRSKCWEFIDICWILLNSMNGQILTYWFILNQYIMEPQATQCAAIEKNENVSAQPVHHSLFTTHQVSSIRYISYVWPVRGILAT